jgi:hypothetical protein
MDVVTISLAVIALIETAQNTAKFILKFMRTYRDARDDLSAIHTELTRLNVVLDCLKYDLETVSVPSTGEKQILDIAKRCESDVKKIDAILQEHDAAERPACGGCGRARTG